jgi:hypothetical protein
MPPINAHRTSDLVEKWATHSNATCVCGSQQFVGDTSAEVPTAVCQACSVVVQLHPQTLAAKFGRFIDDDLRAEKERIEELRRRSREAEAERQAQEEAAAAERHARRLKK